VPGRLYLGWTAGRNHILWKNRIANPCC
jgi:hypothetical protein